MKFFKKEKKCLLLKFGNLKFAGQLSDRLRIFTRQNKNLPVLSDSPAVFAKTGFSCNFVLPNREAPEQSARSGQGLRCSPYIFYIVPRRILAECIAADNHVFTQT